MQLSAIRASARRKISLQPSVQQKYTDADLDANINEWLSEVTSWIMEATGIWEFNGQMWTADLVQGQSEYVLPISSVMLNRVELKYPGQSGFALARRIDDKQVEGQALANGQISQAADGAPLFRVFDNSIVVYPTPNAGVVGGMKIETMEDITQLTSASDIPNLNPLFHKALAIGAAYEYHATLENGRKAAALWNRLVGKFEGDTSSLKYQIQNLAAMRDRTTKPRIIPRKTSYR